MNKQSPMEKKPTFEDTFAQIKQMVASMEPEKARTFLHGLRTGLDAAIFRADDLKVNLAADAKLRDLLDYLDKV